jgi:hypothetical protein
MGCGATMKDAGVSRRIWKPTGRLGYAPCIGCDRGRSTAV